MKKIFLMLLLVLSLSLTACKGDDCEHSWSFEGCEGKPTKIYVFADCDEIYAEINGREIGRQQRNEKGIYIFDAVYEKGYVSATAVINGVITGKYKLVTEDQPFSISLKKEKSYLARSTKKTEDNIVYVDVEIHDKRGNLCTQSTSLVNYEAEGAEIIGVGSGYLLERSAYTDTSRRAHQGTSVVILKKYAASAKLIAKSDDLLISEIDI